MTGAGAAASLRLPTWPAEAEAFLPTLPEEASSWLLFSPRVCWLEVSHFHHHTRRRLLRRAPTEQG